MKTEQVIEQFGEMIISRMEQMKSQEWTKGWIGSDFGGMPMNLSGREYSGLNSMLLFLVSEMKGYQFPIYMTFHQIKELGASVNKGEKSFPVLFWSIVKHKKDGTAIPEEVWNKLSDEAKRECNTYPVLRSYNVFNIAQTNLENVAPQKIEKIKKKYKVGELPQDTEGMYENAEIDDMLAKQTWVCPIISDKVTNSACYSPSLDNIKVPMKRQFKIGETAEEIYFSGQQFYSTLIHEMAHSTGHASRLNRHKSTLFGSSEYSKEELVAELTSALVGQKLGFDYRIIDSNACYLEGWIKIMKKEPKFIVSVLADVSKASAMILEN